MKRRGDEKGEPVQMARRGDTPRSQDTARRTLSDRLESLAADPKDVDADLIKSELEKIASGDELSQIQEKPDLATPGEKPEENIAVSEHVLNSELNLEQDQPPKMPEAAEHGSAESTSAERYVAHASAATEDSETEEPEPADDAPQHIPNQTENLVDAWMGEEIGAPRPTMTGASQIPSRNADILINSHLSDIPPTHDYPPLSAGANPMSANHDESGAETALTRTPENIDAPIDFRDGLGENYPELRSLREPPQDSMLGFYVALAVVFIGSTFGTLYILNQLDSSDTTAASIDQTIVAPASTTQSSTIVSITPAEETTTQFAAAASATVSETTEATKSTQEEHPLLAALNKIAIEKSATPAESDDRAAQSSSNFSVDNISGRAGTSLAINVTLPAEEFGKEAYIVFRGLPEVLSLSKGEKRDESSWRVRMSELSDLALNTPQRFAGSFILEVILIRGEDAAPETRISAVDIAPAVATLDEMPAKPAEENSSTSVASLESGNDAAAKATNVTAPGKLAKEVSERTEHQVRTLSESQEISILSRGGSLLDNGDISGARLLFEYLAQQGSALGAVAYAKTFDPNLFQKAYVRGPVPSADKALKWYGRAVELGNKEALTRLNYLRSQQKAR